MSAFDYRMSVEDAKAGARSSGDDTTIRDLVIDECIAEVDSKLSESMRSGRHVDLYVLRQAVRESLRNLKGKP